MSSIKYILTKYHKQIDFLDIEILIAAAIGKPREFVLTHPEHKIPVTRNLKLETFIQRRLKNEPLAYILGQKEFYGLKFKVDKNTLIPRPETELIVENVLKLQPKNSAIIDVGTGSGNMIISLVKNLAGKNTFFATDISSKALIIAKQNAHFHKVSNKIKFLHGNLLEPIIRNSKLKTRNFIIVSNLPYLSSKIYSKISCDIKIYEPKIALYSPEAGLAHYKELFKQLETLQVSSCKPCLPAGRFQVFLEFSPEQKAPLKKAAQSIFPMCHMTFFKDLAGKFRVAWIKL
jgi:release factor glutamine methyltransferase